VSKNRSSLGRYRGMMRVAFGDRCLACGEQYGPGRVLSLDHVIPLSKGGRNCLANLQPLCAPCNVTKGSETTDYRRSLPYGRYPASNSIKFRCAVLYCRSCRQLNAANKQEWNRVRKQWAPNAR
jgi:hypothetical protein